MYLTIQGLVLRVTDYNDRDALLTLLTANHGKITVKARGLRRKNSPLVAPCQLLAFGEYTLFENRGYYTANEKTAEELIKTARIVDEALKADEKSPCILTPEALDEMGLVLLSAYPIQAVPAEVSSGFEIVGSDEKAEAKDDKKDLDGETATENVTPTEQVSKSDKSVKKGKSKKKAKNDSPTNI